MKWTIEQVAGEKSTAYLRAQMQNIDKVETPDDKTVRLVMKEPVATVPLMFANFHMPIISRVSDAKSPVGAGPFMIKAQERGVSIELEASPKYYKPGLPKLKAIRAIAYADENLRVAALQAGDVDLIEYVPWQSMEAIGKDAKLTLDAVDGPYMYLIFNATKPPFNDARVRKAVAHAIKRDEVVKAAFFGRGSGLAHLPIPKASEFFNPEHRERLEIRSRPRQEAARRGGASERLRLLVPVDRAVRHAQGLGRGRAAESRRDRHQGGAQPAGLGDARRHRQQGPVRHGDDGRCRRQQRSGRRRQGDRRLARGVLHALVRLEDRQDHRASRWPGAPSSTRQSARRSTRSWRRW